MSSIPWDILNILYLYNRNSFVITCKEFNNKYKKEVIAIEKIQEWWDNHCVNYNPLSEKSVLPVFSCTKRRLVYYYNRYYEWSCLKIYPTILAVKCNKLDLLSKAKDAESVGTRQSIIKFLLEPSITREDIMHTGW